jgi:hypothetical protein
MGQLCRYAADERGQVEYGGFEEVDERQESLFSADVPFTAPNPDDSDDEDSNHPDGPKQLPYCSYLGVTDAKNSRFKKQFSRLLLRIHVQRSSQFYLTNVALILLGVTSLSLCTIAYVPTDLTVGLYNLNAVDP